MLLKNGLTVTDQGIQEVDIRIKEEKISAVEKEINPLCGEEIVQLDGKLVLPGIIDSHTHFKLKSRDTVTADDFYWGGRSAAFGGVTTVIDYADMLPDSLLAGLKTRIAEAQEAVIDYNLHLTINDNFQPVKHLVELSELRKAGVSSLKLFTTYRDLYLLNEEKMYALFKAAREAELLLCVHAEKDAIICSNEEKYRSLGKLGVNYHSDIRPGVAEGEAVKELCLLARKIGSPLYLVHLSSKEGYQEVLTAFKKGVRVIAETTPHYLLLTRKLLEGSAGRFNLMTPPLRSVEDNQVLWKGIAEGLIKVVATDHCAFSIEQKSWGDNSLEILPGVAGVETLLPLIYTYGVREGRISLNEMVELLSTNPAKIFGLYPEKGSLKEGTDADLVVYDPDINWVLKGDLLHSRARHTPFQGMKVKGKVVLTILRGKVLVKGDQFLGQKGYGKYLKAGRSAVFK